MDLSEHRQRLITIAYHLLGSVPDAEDIVQEVFQDVLSRAEFDKIEHQKAYLNKATVYKSLSLRQRNLKKLADYPGLWLPEPVFPEEPSSEINRLPNLRYGLLVLIQKLSPLERAIFVLKKMFDYKHEELADLLDISLSNCRKILSRATKKIESKDLEVVTSQEEKILLDRLIQAIQNDDPVALRNCLMEDVSVEVDGGNKIKAARNIIKSHVKVSKYLQGVYRKFFSNDYLRVIPLPQGWGIMAIRNGQISGCLFADIREGKIQKLFFVINPDKLSVKKSSNLVT